jgi:hypothetical protein
MRNFLKVYAFTALVAVFVPLIGLISGCTGADEPKLADAPAVDTSKPKEQAKIPGQKKAFADQPDYQKYMSTKGGGQGK